MIPSRGAGAGPGPGPSDPIAPSALNYFENSILQGPADLSQPATAWQQSGATGFVNRYVVEAGARWGLDITGVSANEPRINILLHYCGSLPDDLFALPAGDRIITVSGLVTEAGAGGSVGPLFSLTGLSNTELAGNHRDKPVPVGERVYATWRIDSASWVANSRLYIGWANSAWATTFKMQDIQLTVGTLAEQPAYQPTYLSDANIGYRGELTIGQSGSSYGYQKATYGALNPQTWAQGIDSQFEIADDTTDRVFTRNDDSDQLYHDIIYLHWPEYAGGFAERATWNSGVQWRSDASSGRMFYVIEELGNAVEYWRSAYQTFPEDGPDNWRTLT